MNQNKQSADSPAVQRLHQPTIKAHAIIACGYADASIEIPASHQRLLNQIEQLHDDDPTLILSIITDDYIDVPDVELEMTQTDIKRMIAMLSKAVL